MNLTTLATFFRRVASQANIHTSHVSIYVLLFHYWHSNRYQNPIQISRADVMKKAKINSKATYHKCIKDLNDLGYIIYNPSYHPVKGSEVHLVNIENNSSDEIA